jgi:hypothetical protein
MTSKHKHFNYQGVLTGHQGSLVTPVDIFGIVTLVTRLNLFVDYGLTLLIIITIQ